MSPINKLILLFILLSGLSCSFMISPQVVSVSPLAGQNILSTNLQISLEFSKDMDKNATEQAFSLYLSYDRGSKIEGDFSWSGDSVMTFTPLHSSLEYPEQYIIQLQASAMDQDGNGLQDNVYSTFSLLSNLGRPMVTATYPLSGSTNFSVYSNVIISFSLNMSTNECRNAFSISPSIQGNINIYSNQLVFAPDSPFQNGVYYTVTLASSARATNTVTLLNDLEFYFLPGQDFTVPELSALRTNLFTFDMTNLQQDIEKTTSNLILVFNTDMDRPSVESGLSLEPGLNYYLSWISNNIASINLLEPMLPSTNYTLTLDKSVKSIYGRTFIEQVDREYITDGPLSRLVSYISTVESTNNDWYPETINTLELGATNSISVTVTFSSLSSTNVDWISVYNNSEISFISGENGLKQGEISDIIPLDININQFLFVIDNLAISNIYKLSLKGGINGIQDVLQNHLDGTIDIYFTATN